MTTADTFASISARLFKRRRIVQYPHMQTPCWEWTGSCSRGYGQITVRRRNTRVHRVAAAIWLGLDLDDPAQLVTHHCDNRLCFNPDHLRLGTHTSNLLEAYARQARPAPGWLVHRGERNPRAKLTAHDAAAIKAARAAGVALKVLADRYGVSLPTVCDIAKGRTWRDA